MTETLEQRFNTLTAEWRQGICHESSSQRIAAHPAYQAIIALGMPVVPLILASLRAEPHHWFNALTTITGANPVPPEARGRIQMMADAWVAWGIANGLLPTEK
jgi:hypothetical protein